MVTFEATSRSPQPGDNSSDLEQIGLRRPEPSQAKDPN